MNLDANTKLYIGGGIIILLVIIVLWVILSRKEKECPGCSMSCPGCPGCPSCPGCPTPAATPAPKTTRELLNQKCPLSGSETRGGVVYINQTNIATRDDYLFSGCIGAATCDSTTPDPISKRLINAPEPCGAWHLDSDTTQPTYRFNPTLKKWIHNGDRF